MRVKLAADGSFILYREIKAPEGYSFSKSRQEDVLTLSTSEMARVIADLSALRDSDDLHDLERQMEMLRPKDVASTPSAPPVPDASNLAEGSSVDITHTAHDPAAVEPQS